MKKRSNLFRLLAYIKPYWPAYVFTVLMGLIKFLTPVAVIWVFGEAIDVFTLVQAEELDRNEAWQRLQSLFFTGIFLVLFSPLPTFLRSLVGAKVNTRVIRDIRCDLYAHVQKLSHSFYDRNRSGALTSRIISDVETINPFLNRTVIQLWMNLGMVVAILVYFFSQNTYLGLLSISLIPIQLVILLTIGRRIRKIATQIRSKLSELSGSTQEVLAAATVVKAFTQETDEIRKFSDDSEDIVTMGVRNAMLGGLNQMCTQMLNHMAPLLVILIGGRLALFSPEVLSAGLLVKFVMMQAQLYGPFERLSETQIVTADALGSVDRIFEIFDTEPEIRDKPAAIKDCKLEGNVCFINTAFSYPTGKKILDDFNITIPARTSMALVGPSGGGKSTVGRLLHRFYDLQAGQILIDGRDITDYRILALRRQIGLVPQEPVLFSGTVLENILYGRPDATLEEVYEAAHNANAMEFINQMPNGINTVIGESGATLSGGQKQRLAIARAFLKNPPILILDEATSALDSESEKKVQASLNTLMQGRTTIIIAHRLSTIMKANCIAVIDAGRVVEQGTHSQLLANKGLYAKLCSHQFEVAGFDVDAT